MKAKKWTHGTIGSVSSYTMRAEDLIPSFVSELRWLGHRSKTLSQIERNMDKQGYYETEDCLYDLESLFDMLNEHALPYTYFGSHPGDGADYGFWISEELDFDDDLLKVSDISEIPDRYTGDVIVVNDHGNMTLYVKNKLPVNHPKALKEIWAAV